MLRPITICLLTPLLFAFAGCARTVVESPSNTGYPAGDVNGQLEFWHTLDGRSAITNDEAMHAVLILADGDDPTLTYETRLAELKERGWLNESFDEAPNIAVQRGTLAKMLAFAIDAPQGVMSSIFNRSPRYALADLIAVGIMPAGSQLMAIDGREFLGVIALAEDYRAVRNARQASDAAPVEEQTIEMPADAG